jgi:hypothetical protein
VGVAEDRKCDHDVPTSQACVDCEVRSLAQFAGLPMSQLCYHVERIAYLRGWDLAECLVELPLGEATSAWLHCKGSRMEKRGGRNVTIVPGAHQDVAIVVAPRDQPAGVRITRNGDRIFYIDMRGYWA